MRKSTLLPLALLALAAPAGAAGLELPERLETVPDGRPPLESLYATYLSLADAGWRLDVIVASEPAGTAYPLPVIALRSPHTGPAVWIIAGIHGEEPAGPAAVAATVDAIAALGRTRPVVLLPLANPHGYARNWRYLNTPVWSAEVEGQSVGDSSHLLPEADNERRGRAPAASSPEAAAITAYVVATAGDYPPVISIDLHEDDILEEGYVYSQGTAGAADRFAAAAVRVFREQQIPIKLDGLTRFDEPIANGIIGPVTDSSIDELLSAPRIVLDAASAPGPAAATVLVFETPARQFPLERRIAAHAALLRRMLAMVSDGAE